MRLCPDRTPVPALGYLTRSLIVLVSLWCVACGSSGKEPATTSAEPDRFLFEQGTAALQDKKWLKAREYFREIVDSYPQSTYRADAKLGVGDSYLGENSVESRILPLNEFREFLTYFPTHPRADYAQYKLGLAHFSQIAGPPAGSDRN